MKVLLRGTLATLLGSVTLLVASAAWAEGEACYNDDDCPNPACGGDVCNWLKAALKPDGRKAYYCQPAGKAPKGSDGWCESDANCKCKDMGATCQIPYCTVVQPPAGAGGSASGGAAAGGSAAGGSATAGGAPATAGAPTSSAGTGTAPTTPASSDSGGCSVSAPGNAGSAALLLAAAGVGFAFTRRRR